MKGKKLGLIIIFMLCVNISYADKYTTKDCLNKTAVGNKAWQVVMYCGKPIKTSQLTAPAKVKKNYDIYEYTLHEPICYTQLNQPQVLCNAKEKGDVTLYFDNHALVMVEVDRKKVNNLFLKFNQKIVLGSSMEHVISLWGKPNVQSSKKLAIPIEIETWYYKNIVFTIKSGIVTKMTPV